MSLIHDALKESGTVAMPSRPAARGSWWARQPVATRRLLPVAAIALVAVPVLLLSGVRALRGDATPTPAVVAAVAPPPAVAEPPPRHVPVPDADMAPAPLPSEPQPQERLPERIASAATTATMPQAEGQRLAAQPDTAPPPASQGAEGAPDSSTPGHTAPPPARTALAATTGTTQQPSIKVERHTANGHGAGKATGSGDDGAVEQAVGSIEAAMADGDLPTAHQALARLDALLPAESLTLLRMHAWLAHAGGDAAAAEKLYRRIAERVPGDINAGVNTALLEARRGELDDARRRLAQLSGRNPRSPQVARALAELEAAQP